MRVSVPGRNVLNEDLPGRYVAFDTRWIGSSRILRMGRVNLSANGSATVNFGLTLPKAPAVIAMFRQRLFLGSAAYNMWAPLENSASSREFTGTPAAGTVNAALRPEANAAVDVRTDRVIFRNPGSLAGLVSFIILRL